MGETEGGLEVVGLKGKERDTGDEALIEIGEERTEIKAYGSLMEDDRPTARPAFRGIQNSDSFAVRSEFHTLAASYLHIIPSAHTSQLIST